MTTITIIETPEIEGFRDIRLLLDALDPGEVLEAIALYLSCRAQNEQDAGEEVDAAALGEAYSDIEEVVARYYEED